MISVTELLVNSSARDDRCEFMHGLYIVKIYRLGIYLSLWTI